MKLTKEGKFFKKQAEQMVEYLDKTLEQIKEMKSGVSGTLFIGSIETVGTALLPQWIAELKKEYSAVKYNLWSGNSDDVIQRLENGLVDVALIREPFDLENFNYINIKYERWIAVLHKDHPLAYEKYNYIKLRELSNEELIV